MRSGNDFRWVEVSPDYWGRMQGFECARPLDDPFEGAERRHGRYYRPWELEVQSTVRRFRKCDPASQWADLCVSADANGDERIWAFVWYGIIGGRKTNADGTYMIGYIARALSASGCRIGDAALSHALRVLRADHEATGRDPVVGARIDPSNGASGALFSRHGFVDAGVDPEATEYHRWLRFGFDGV
ncbi:hypothetical protein [Bifidobacterium vespertilionis]|uniref:hypothetical protein n=1 Tax=Bifidobacterium vespertilionis TaxID=2562524 RepID=UPI001BDC7712|nr:hypothetical protein [Bifidobacterium vespertilionis]MBT1179634.1 hypothetical protein [Bifidobacterium vespertilionis]